MKSPVYWHPAIYNLLMRFLYGKNFEARYRAIAELIPDNANVTEVCAGDGYLFRKYLKKKNIKYIGLDINSSFVKYGQQNNIPIMKHDLFTDEIPSSDYVIIHGSLCQFIPNHEVIVKKLLAASKNVLLIAEPVRNLSSSSNPLVAFIAKYSANPGDNHAVHRFNKDTLIDFFQHFREFKEVKEMDGGRELIGIFRK